jgi:hypothetical protein
VTKPELAVCYNVVFSPAKSLHLSLICPQHLHSDATGDIITGRDVHMANIAILFLIKNIPVGKNVKLSLRLLEHHNMKTYGGVEM